ncbi:MAG: LysR family transcriptional regulator, partial [Candidatus Eremiobacteraeota bacterium]|nr:LysR family transcriptional regulator [Candidatus Eremiobacteraeota bacterium]
MNVEFALLESFLILAEVQHFGEAAGRLNISQPALSKQVKRLETRLGGLLIDRDTRHFALTPAGQVLLDSARSLVRQAELAERRVSLAFEGKAGSLRIGFGIANLSAGLGRLLRDFRVAFPEVRVELKDMSTPAQLKAL